MFDNILPTWCKYYIHEQLQKKAEKYYVKHDSSSRLILKSSVTHSKKVLY